MLHFILLNRRSGNKHYCISLWALAIVMFSSVYAVGAATTTKNILNKVTLENKGSDLNLSISGSTVPTYTIYELFKPSRIVVDVADSVLAEDKSFSLPADSKIKLATKSIQDGNPPVTRFEFFLPHSYSFTTQQLNNDIVITVQNFNEQKQSANQTIEDQLPTINPLSPAPEKETTATTSMEDSFNFSGYNKERITVDFYKIDLHNVFRLIREVSGINIVVDEAVAGSLTLSLNDVPWDFALDIILNLKNLQKEERFNTIVIHPKSKTFTWPERAADNLSFESDEDMVTEEALVIQQQENVAPAVVEAKLLISKAKQEESKGNEENAVQLYEQAFKKWPHNARLANKIAAIYLVQLRLNAKAAYFADKALSLDNKNSSAALNNAIAHANMRENKLAQQYFDQAINIGKPSKDALLSYAAFTEQSGQYDVAVELLLKHDDIFGQDLDSMVARARVLDKKGNKSEATKVYQTILLAGFRVPHDLKKFITDRTKLSQSM